MKTLTWMPGLLFVTSILFAQAPDTLWTRTYGGAGNDHCTTIRAVPGAYLLAGHTNSYGNGEADFWLIRTFRDGTVDWDRTFGGTRWDSCMALEMAPDGHPVLAGGTRSTGMGNGDQWLVYCTTQGFAEWSYPYGDNGYQTARGVAPLIDGGFALAGDYCFFMDPDTVFHLRKIYSNGDQEWEQFYGITSHGSAHYVREVQDGGLLAVGIRESNSVLVPYVVRTNDEGQTAYQRFYTDYAEADVGSGCPTADGGLLVAATLGDYSHGEEGQWKESLVIKLSWEGPPAWVALCGIPYDDGIRGIAETPDGGVIAVGWYSNPSDTTTGIYVVRMAEMGDTLWTKRIQTGEPTTAVSVAALIDSGYVIAANTTERGAGGEDFWLIRLDADPVSIEARHGVISRWSLSQNYPNPFNSRTIIPYELAQTGVIALDVFDVLGRRVAVLETGTQTAGRHAMAFDADDLPSGTYLCRLMGSGTTQVRTMILEK